MNPEREVVMRGMKVFVRNTPAGPCEKYVVARVVDGELWYWGAWSDMNEAYAMAKMLGGVVCENSEED